MSIQKQNIFHFDMFANVFYNIINNYVQHEVDFRFMSKTNFNQVCKFLNPQHMISLILSNGNETCNEIELFLQ